MSPSGIQQDMQYLAGALPHRGANTESERAAAEYIHRRFGEYTADANLDDFHSIESHCYLFATYYAEFAVVALVAGWWPRVALCYGAAVFLAYLGEFLGFHTFSRLMPHFETQNVIARFLATRPTYLFVVSAHYDSPRDTLFTHPRVLPWMRAAHWVVFVCMLLVLLTCAVDALELSPEEVAAPASQIVRWSAAGVLVAAALALFYSAANGDFVRGANSNASGVAALIDLARRLSEKPLEETDVWLVATGSGDTWMSGMHHFVTSYEIDRERTYFLNIEHVGAGQLHYLTGEGLLHVFPSAPEWLEAAQAAAPRHAATPRTLRAVPTDALIPHARGFKTLGIAALDPSGIPQDWHWYTDTLVRVEYASIETAAAFAEDLLRQMETNLTGRAPAALRETDSG